jgi:hypothetical protein
MESDSRPDACFECRCRQNVYMSKNAPRDISEIEDPAEAVIASAEWIVTDEWVTFKLEELRKRREARGEESC